MSTTSSPKCEQLLETLRLRETRGSYSIAIDTLHAFEEVINTADLWINTQQLISIVHQLSSQFEKANPTETVPRNIALRLLKIIRDEFLTWSAQGQTPQLQRITRSQPAHVYYEEHLQRLLINDDHQPPDYGQNPGNLTHLRQAINEAIGELRLELDTSAEIISKQALEHVYSNELVLTLGRSKSVEAFLKYAAKKNRKFQVVVAEAAPFNHGHELAISLSKVGISCTVIPDSAIFAIMSRVNKVVIGTHSVMANGGLKAVSGAYSIALAAKHFSVPLIVCTAMFKLSPQYVNAHDQVTLNKFGSPHQLLPYGDSRLATGCRPVNPVFDYVPPELVTIFVSNIGGNSPSYVYRLLSELYHSEDILAK